MIVLRCLPVLVSAYLVVLICCELVWVFFCEFFGCSDGFASLCLFVLFMFVVFGGGCFVCFEFVKLVVDVYFVLLIVVWLIAGFALLLCLIVQRWLLYVCLCFVVVFLRLRLAVVLDLVCFLILFVFGLLLVS